jgi:uncharacterized membrane protein
VALAVIGATAEVLGLWYAVFGEYAYTPLWWPSFRLSNGYLFPYLVPLTWFFFLTACYLAVPAKLQGWRRVLAAALLTTLVDFCMEPVLAGPVRFWVWTNPTPFLEAPLQNSLGWLVVALTGASTLYLLGIRRGEGILARTLLISVLAFTFVIGLLFSRAGALLTILPGVFLLTLQVRRDRATLRG